MHYQDRHEGARSIYQDRGTVTDFFSKSDKREWQQEAEIQRGLLLVIGSSLALRVAWFRIESGKR